MCFKFGIIAAATAGFPMVKINDLSLFLCYGKYLYLNLYKISKNTAFKNNEIFCRVEIFILFFCSSDVKKHFRESASCSVPKKSHARTPRDFTLSVVKGYFISHISFVSRSSLKLWYFFAPFTSSTCAWTASL